MNNRHAIASILGLILSLFGCTNSVVQHREAPLSPSSPEDRANAEAKYTRVLNPSNTKSRSSAIAAADINGNDTQAEAQFRKNQQAAAEHEKFIKDLDTVTKSK